MGGKKGTNNSHSGKSNSDGFVLTITPLTGVACLVLLAALLFAWDQYRQESYCEVVRGNFDDRTEWFTADHKNKEEYLKYEQGTFIYRHIYMENFEEVFGVKPLHFPIIDDDIVDIMAKHNLRARLENNTDYDRNVILSILKESDTFAPVVERVKQEVKNGTYVDDGRIYIRWVNDIVRYGLFAGRYFKTRDLIEIYAGLITRQLSDLEYAWEFNYLVDVKDDNDEKVRVCIDAKFSGNYVRFANHKDHNQNGDQLYVVHDDLWHVVYTAKTDIREHEQIFVNYGQAYWENKKKYDFV